MKLYATEYQSTSIDREILTTIEVEADRFIDLLSKNKNKAGFKGVYAI